MIRSLNTAEKAMQVLQVKIDALANNLANADATGFRQVLTRVTEESVPGSAGGKGVSSATRTSFRAKDSVLQLTNALDVRPGAIKATGRQTDLALMGKGFFVIATDGGERYTRDGSFMLNEKRQLITSDGHLVQGEGGPLTLEGGDMSVEPDGTVVSDGNIVGNLKIVDFDQAYRLEHQGANLLAAPADMTATPVPRQEVAVAQGHLEESNVNPIDTLVAMIQAQRAFEVQAKIMTTEDEMLNKAVNYLPRATG